MSAWLLAFTLTQLIEMPIYCYALRERTLAHRVWFSFLPSALTHPVVWFIFPQLVTGSYLSMVAAAESFAILGEAILLQRIGSAHALRYSIVANCASLSIGLACRVVFGIP